MSKVLEELKRVLGVDTEGDDLAKAAKAKTDGDDAGKKGKDDDDDYDPKYMKRNMPRYKKENPDSDSNYMKGGKGMQKAADKVDDLSSPDDVNSAEAVVLDGTDMFKAFVTLSTAFTETLNKSSEIFNARMGEVNDKLAELKELSEATGAVMAKAASDVDTVASQPLPRRGVAATDVGGGVGGASEPNSAIERVKLAGMSGCKTVLQKACLAGNQDAMIPLTQVESSFGRADLLPQPTVNFINSLLIADAGGQ